MKKRSIKYRKELYQGVGFYGIDLNTDSVKELGSSMAQTLRNNSSIGNGEVEIDFMPIDKGRSKMMFVEPNKKAFKVLTTPQAPRHFSPEEIIEINADAQNIFKEDGVYGTYGVKSYGQIEYICARLKDSYVFGEDILPTLFDKCVFVWQRLAKNQSFQNGNKRTALLTVAMYLYMNYFNFDTRTDLLKIYEDYSIRIAIDNITSAELKYFLIKNTYYDFDRAADDYIALIKNSK